MNFWMIVPGEPLDDNTTLPYSEVESKEHARRKASWWTRKDGKFRMIARIAGYVRRVVEYEEIERREHSTYRGGA